MSPEEIKSGPTSPWLKWCAFDFDPSCYQNCPAGGSCFGRAGGLFFHVKRLSQGRLRGTAAAWSSAMFGTLSPQHLWRLCDTADINLGMRVASTFAATPPRRPVAGCACCTMRPIVGQARPEFPLHLPPRWAGVRLTHQGWPASSIATEIFFFFSKIPARVKCQWGLCTGRRDSRWEPTVPIDILVLERRIRAGPTQTPGWDRWNQLPV